MKFVYRPVLLLLLTIPLYIQAQTNVIDSLQSVVSQQKKDLNELKALNKLADEYLRKDLQKALEFQRPGIQLAKVLNNPVFLSSGYHLMISIHSNAGNSDSAKHYLNLLAQLSANVNNDTIHGNYNSAAGLQYKAAGEFKKALPYLVKVEQLAANMHNKINQAGACINIGNTYNSLGEYKGALHYQLKALRLFEEAGNRRGESFCYSNIGNLFISLHQYLPAKQWFEKSLQLKKELNDKRGVGTALSGLAQVHNGLKEYDRAVVYGLEAVAVSKEIKLLKLEADNYLELANIYYNKGEITKAREYFNQCKDLAVQTSDSSMARLVDAKLLSMQTDGLKQQQVARKLNVSLQQSIERGDKKNELAGYKYLSEYYAVNKQFERALEYNRKYHEGSAAVGNNDLQLEIKKLESQYNLEKKEQEIALLKKDQQLQKLGMQRQKTFQYSAVVLLCLLAFIAFLVINRYRVVQQSKRLMEIEGVRNTIARDLHDDMGSVLSSIHINSKMALENAESPGQVNEHLKKIRENSGYMLESMNDIVWAINPANDTLEKVIIHMKEFAADILEPKDIRYEFVIDDDLNSEKLNPKQRKDFYLIYKEAINNAAKYSHCKRVIVKLSKVKNNIMLQVTDDGAGFNSQTIKRGNGLINMAHRAKQMNGEIKISSAINHGTTVTLHTISPA